MACPNLSDYIKAGFTPICGCRLDTALDYVYHQTFLTRMGVLKDGWVQYDAEHSSIMVNIGDEEMPMFVASNYYWEQDTLFRR